MICRRCFSKRWSGCRKRQMDAEYLALIREMNEGRPAADQCERCTEGLADWTRSHRRASDRRGNRNEGECLGISVAARDHHSSARAFRRPVLAILCEAHRAQSSISGESCGIRSKASTVPDRRGSCSRRAICDGTDARTLVSHRRGVADPPHRQCAGLVDTRSAPFRWALGGRRIGVVRHDAGPLLQGRAIPDPQSGRVSRRTHPVGQKPRHRLAIMDAQRTRTAHAGQYSSLQHVPHRQDRVDAQRRAPGHHCLGDQRLSAALRCDHGEVSG